MVLLFTCETIANTLLSTRFSRLVTFALKGRTRQTFYCTRSAPKMTTDHTSNNFFLKALKDEAEKLAPSLSSKDNYKGTSGKIAVVGGSFEYTGAPYFASISALKTGADLVHVFCARDAAIPIKCYSPELIVHPLLQPDGLNKILNWLERMDVVLIGCGLGRNEETLQLIQQIIGCMKKIRKPLILDADALFLVVQKPSILSGFKSPVILTPNRMELARLLGISDPSGIKDEDILKGIRSKDWSEHVTLLVKAGNDQVYTKSRNVTFVNFGGSGRRCGGQGDILGGCLSVFLTWSMKNESLEHPAFVAAYAACKLTRECNRLAFTTAGRSMTAGDMIEQIHKAFDMHFEVPSE